jgi:hypothetical protein
VFAVNTYGAVRGGKDGFESLSFADVIATETAESLGKPVMIVAVT